ncbi:MAG TPA: DnaJ domain-containing protein [Nitrospiria bacterium]|nr:DnaJ domain-containing protein [Nitrospiria bacterium]
MSDRYTDEQTMALRRQLFRRIAELQALNTDCQNYALDQVITERMDTYFRLEERLDEINSLCLRIAQELEEAASLAALRQLDGRLNFIEDCFDELESEIRDRPQRRRRRRFNVADFFRQWAAGGGQQGDLAGLGEIGSASEAYRELGVTAESDARAIMAAFRRLVKELHPDARGGDRSTEPRLRRIVAAYEFLKRLSGPR